MIAPYLDKPWLFELDAIGPSWHFHDIDSSVCILYTFFRIVSTSRVHEDPVIEFTWFMDNSSIFYISFVIGLNFSLTMIS